MTGSLYQHNSSPLSRAGVPQWIERMLTRVRSGVRPCPQLHQNAVLHQGHSPPSRFLDRSRKPGTEDVDTSIQAADSCAFFDMIWAKALPSYLRLPGLGPDPVWASVWTSYPPAAHATSQAGLGQKRCQEGARRHVTPRGVVTHRVWPLAARLPTAVEFRDVVQAQYRAQKESDT
jgi:hypothetical protein